MPITTLASLRSALDGAIKISMHKFPGSSGGTVNHSLAPIWDWWTISGFPSAGTHSGSLIGTTYSKSSAGAQPLGDSTIAGNRYALASVQTAAQMRPSSAAGEQLGGTEYYIHIWDRMWANNGISTNTTALQAWTPVALPARAGTGEGLSLWCVTTVSYPPIDVTPTITYINQAGVSRTIAPPEWLLQNRFGFSPQVWPVPLLASDSGIRSVNSVRLNGTTIGGQWSFMIAKYLGCYRVGTGSNSLNMAPRSLFAGMPQFDGDACLCYGIQPAGVTNTFNSLVWPEIALEALVIPL